MATRIIHGTQLFEGIWKRTTEGTFLWNLVKIQSIVSEEKFFKEKVYGRTHGRTDGRTDARRHHAMTIARWPSASGAKNLLQIPSPIPAGGRDFWKHCGKLEKMLVTHQLPETKFTYANKISFVLFVFSINPFELCVSVNYRQSLLQLALITFRTYTISETKNHIDYLLDFSSRWISLPESLLRLSRDNYCYQIPLIA